MRTLLLAVALLSGLAFGQAANATPITGMISIDGTANYTDSSVSFPYAGGVATGTATGSFQPAFSAGCFSCVTLTGFNFASFSGPVTVYDAIIGVNSTSFVITSIVSSSTADGFLSITADGYATETGFDNTAGVLKISSQGGENANVSFSATTAAVPEPLSLAMLGSGLVAMGLVRRKKSV